VVEAVAVETLAPALAERPPSASLAMELWVALGEPPVVPPALVAEARVAARSMVPAPRGAMPIR
jgi:hypothetical protein